MARVMSDTELRHRKKLQGTISQTTGALGLTALGGTMLATRRGGAATKAAFKAVGRSRPAALKPGKLRAHTAPILATSAGLGGLGSFNFAAYTNAESKKRKTMAPIQKSQPLEMGYYGEEGHPVEMKPVVVPIEKAWAPAASNFDSENSRKKRADVYQAGALAGAGAGGTYSLQHGLKAFKAARKVKPTTTVGQLKPLGRHAGKAVLGAGAVAAGVGAATAIGRKKQSGWQPYSKRDTTNPFQVKKSINIKPENKGKFTAMANKAGKSVQEEATSILNSSKSTPLQRKRANFARNARKWNH